MNLYQQTTVAGEAYTRCKQIVVENPLNNPPLVRFDEERVVVLGAGAPSTQPAGTLAVPFDPALRFALMDPATGEPTGQSMAYGEAYAVLYSAYLGAAHARDEASEPAAPSAE